VKRTLSRIYEYTASLRGLDWISFLMADVREGVGPYLSPALPLAVAAVFVFG
jgi:hypothetical protein